MPQDIRNIETLFRQIQNRLSSDRPINTTLASTTVAVLICYLEALEIKRSYQG